jgi:hypothetical protein
MYEIPEVENSEILAERCRAVVDVYADKLGLKLIYAEGNFPARIDQRPGVRNTL